MKAVTGRPGLGAAVALVAALTVLAWPSPPVRADIRSSKHNLSVSGTGTIKASTEDRVCRFCHVPHNANPAVPLWGHGSSAAAYTIYASASIQGSIGQPNGSSKLCLSCHDGAFSVGGVSVSRTVPTGSFTMTAGNNFVAGTARLGTNLADDHPVSLTVAIGGGADPEIVSHPADTDVKYDGGGRVQCTSCHDPHDDTNARFLVKANVLAGVGSQICVACHAKTNWANASHRNSTKIHGSQTVQAEACAACHATHTAPVPGRLLKGAEEGLCNACHNGSNTVTPAIKNVTMEFARAYRHPTASVFGRHDTAETEANLVDPLLRHAECEDCHNPHSAVTGAHSQGSSRIGAVLLGAWGLRPVYGGGAWVDPISWERVTFTDTTDYVEAYLCFKCHRSKARDFNPNNPSYHAVLGTPKARPSFDGSYLNGWSSASQMTCTDCHTSSNPAVRGPHGSDYNYILSGPYLRGDGLNPYAGTGGTLDLAGGARDSDGDLCFRCHNRSVYGSPTDLTYANVYVSGFTFDGTTNAHIGHAVGVACTSCHVVHGSARRALLADPNDGWDLNAFNTLLSMPATGAPWGCINCHSMP